jgi:hypothetical protein
VSGLAHRDARCDEEAACSADYDETGATSLLDTFNAVIRSADDLAGWSAIPDENALRRYKRDRRRLAMHNHAERFARFVKERPSARLHSSHFLMK